VGLNRPSALAAPQTEDIHILTSHSKPPIRVSKFYDFYHAGGGVGLRRLLARLPSQQAKPARRGPRLLARAKVPRLGLCEGRVAACAHES
jgi:hypothetical protein